MGKPPSRRTVASYVPPKAFAPGVRAALERLGYRIVPAVTRGRFADDMLRTVDDNRSLPALVESGEVDAIVTDSFELADFARPGLEARCEPAAHRKVYWLSPARAKAWGSSTRSMSNTRAIAIRIARRSTSTASYSSGSEIARTRSLNSGPISMQPSSGPVERTT